MKIYYFLLNLNHLFDIYLIKLIIILKINKHLLYYYLLVNQIIIIYLFYYKIIIIYHLFIKLF